MKPNGTGTPISSMNKENHGPSNRCASWLCRGFGTRLALTLGPRQRRPGAYSDGFKQTRTRKPFFNDDHGFRLAGAFKV